MSMLECMSEEIIILLLSNLKMYNLFAIHIETFPPLKIVILVRISTFSLKCLSSMKYFLPSYPSLSPNVYC